MVARREGRGPSWVVMVVSTLVVTGAGAQTHTEAPAWAWQRGTAGDDQVVGLAVGQGGVYVAGQTMGQMEGTPSAGGVDFFLGRLGEDGSQQWLKQAGTAANDYATGVAVDDRVSTAVQVYVVGYTAGGLDGNTPAGGQDVFVRGYDGQGNRRWTRLLGTAAGDFGQAVATGPDGAVYVAGYTSGALGGATAGGQDAFVAKYDGQGNLQWVRQVGTDKNEQARGVAVDAAGGVYVVGQTFGNLGGTNASTTTSDIFVVKYDGQGNEQWRRQSGTAGTETAQGVATSRRTSGQVDVYVAGRTSSAMGGQIPLGSNDVVVMK
jgi:hypothetical protein